MPAGSRAAHCLNHERNHDERPDADHERHVQRRRLDQPQSALEFRRLAHIFLPKKQAEHSKKRHAVIRKLASRQFAATARSGTLPSMLFMVIERFKNGDAGPIGERF